MKIVFTPDWFLGRDVLIDSFSFLILLALFIFAYKSYRLSKNKNSLYLGIGFFLIALGEISTILTKLVLYYDTTFTQTVGQMIITYNVVSSTDICYYIGFFFHKLFTLLGLYVLYRAVIKQRPTKESVLIAYFIIVSSIFSTGNLYYYIFHIAVFLLLVMIIVAYLRIYRKNLMLTTKILITAFSMLALSQVIFILSKLQALYVMGQLIQLASYILFLCLIIIIWKNGKKKKQNRHSVRYAGGYTGKRRKN
jgi:hypothetical protein